jgi:hypothetical protein
MSQIVLLPATVITVAVAGVIDGPRAVDLEKARGVILQGDFVYGSGGTTLKAWVQSTIDGINWYDIACFAFTTANKRRMFNLIARTPVTAIATPGDAALADDTAVDGILGHSLRVKYTSTGTYAGGSTLTVAAVTR